MAQSSLSASPAICLLRLSALGDVTHVVPLVRTLRAARPQASITWVIGKGERRLLEGLEGVDFLEYDKKSGLAGMRALRRVLQERPLPGGRFDVLLQMQVAARANLLASETGADSVRLSIAAAVASAYLGLRTSDARLEVAQRTLVSRENALKLAKRRFDTGYTSRLELAQAQAEYRATAQVVPQLQLAIRRQEDALSVLLGRAPQAITRGKALVDIAAPALPAAGMPSQLLRRRPDIAQAEA
ncbi:TolC family protein, partial [Lysobacter sp. 2RAB21]